MGIKDRLGLRTRRLRAVARKVFGWRDLRPGQVEAMRHLLDGGDALVVMPTGSGKSAVYRTVGQCSGVHAGGEGPRGSAP
ncbi:hypothetical protein GCM10023075_66850 [Streptosporangium album]|uniref:DEAD/DEAH box helicase n=1 Tax=Streptosporangium album TaxID=47479 RepID=UPI0031F17F25